MPSTAPDPEGLDPARPPAFARRSRLLTGWGGTAPSAASVGRPTSPADLAAALTGLPDRGVVGRGLGRGYGDGAQNAGGLVIDTTGVIDFHLDPTTGIVRASAGASLDALMRELVPRGFFVPVTPGTRYVTVGGAIAADIHGKNHHGAGSWGNHVVSIRLGLADGSAIEISPSDRPELFWATVGGMGLTGLILEVSFHCPSIETSRLLVDTDRAPDLDTVLDLMETGDDGYDYSVAWIDPMASGCHLGRSVLTRGRFARSGELDPTDRDPLAYDPKMLAGLPPMLPSGLINRLSVRAFNELWYRRAPVRRRDELQSIATFFHPLDMVDHWNRIYGVRGFVQWQYVLPFGAEDVVRSTIEALSATRCTSFLAVLKRFGPANPAPLSFPMPGWTLAVDVPTGLAGLAGLLDQLDHQVANAGGRIYLAKDSRLRPELLPLMYPRLDEWRAVRDDADPGHRFQSDLSRRLHLS
jgi:decaprenylphospho-beta-D-ribofuranose 2-oxidase